MLGITGFKAKYLRRYADLQGAVREAAISFVREVKEGSFPGDRESYH